MDARYCGIVGLAVGWFALLGWWWAGGGRLMGRVQEGEECNEQGPWSGACFGAACVCAAFAVFLFSLVHSARASAVNDRQTCQTPARDFLAPLALRAWSAKSQESSRRRALLSAASAIRIALHRDTSTRTSIQSYSLKNRTNFCKDGIDHAPRNLSSGHILRQPAQAAA